MAQMNAACSAIVNRARGLADVVNSQFATYNDLTSSLNESWKDLYEDLTDSSDDYFVTLAIGSPVASTAPLNPNEFLIPLPSDYYKLCFIDYNFNGVWQRMRKFTKDGRSNYGSEPCYRFQGPQLWIIGWLGGVGMQIRMAYYPVPDTLYFPNQSFTFSPNLTDIQKSTLQYPDYVPGQLPTTFNQDVNPAQPSYNGMLMVQQGTGILYVSNQTGTTTTVVSSAGVLKHPTYYKGNLFWIQDGNLYGAAFNPASPASVSGVAMTSTADLTWLDVYASTLWFVGQGTAVKNVAIPSTLGAVVGVAVTAPFTPPASVKFFSSNFLGYPVWITSAGALVINNVATAVTGLTYVVTDGTYLYGLLGNTVNRYTFSMATPTAPVLLATEVIATDVSWISDPELGWIGTVGYESLAVTAYSSTPDYVLDYPNNLAPEIMSYQIAMDIKRKQSADADLSSLMARKKELHDRFMDQLRRDDYYPDRISNNRNNANVAGLFGMGQ